MGDSRVAVIIEDDQDIRDLIQVVLSQSGFTVHAVDRGAAGVNAVREQQPDIITLDIGLPDIDGFEVARQIREFSDCYIIMLTSRAEELDTLLGLESGADDYLTKPFRPRELRSRVAAMMRRPRASGPAMAAPDDPLVTTDFPTESLHTMMRASAMNAVLEEAEPELDGASEPAAGERSPRSDGWLEAHGLVLDKSRWVASVDGSPVDLTRSEFDLLLALMESGQVVRTKSELARRLRAEPYDTGSYISEADERTVEVHMGNLRRKLGDNPKEPRWIRTVRGVGYCLEA